jgi:hypothetical protein
VNLNPGQSELEANQLLPEYTGYIRFGMMMDGFLEGFLALNDQRCADAFASTD